jgi:hypothetical protein
MRMAFIGLDLSVQAIDIAFIFTESPHAQVGRVARRFESFPRDVYFNQL